MQQTTIDLVEEILAPYTQHHRISGYKNHVLRVISFCDALYELDEEERHKVTIAACFHDIGIYTDQTFDYLPPSIALARAYLYNNALGNWATEIKSMIDEHHRLRPVERGGLVEVFRKADLIDFSLGFVKHGIPRTKVSEVRSEFPNLGFHRSLARVAVRWICRHPFNPVPVLKW